MASRGINKVILVGNVGQDPDVKSFQSGDQVTSFSLATSDSWRDKVTGEAREKNEWHRISVFGKTANFVSSYVRKGSQVYVEGQLQTRKWQDQNGQDRFTTEVVVRWPNGSLQLIGGRSDSLNPNGSEQLLQNQGSTQQSISPQVNTVSSNQNSWSSDSMVDDDIPF